MRVLGLDIGGTSVKALLYDGLCAQAEVARASSDPYVRPDSQGITAALRQVVDRLGVLPKDIDRIALCAPGRRDEHGRVIASVNLPGLVGKDPDVLVRQALFPRKPPTKVEGAVVEAKFKGGVFSFRGVSDVYAAAFDIERTLPPSDEPRRLCCTGFPHNHRRTGRLLAISIGTGVGACVLDSGERLRISGESSGHFGQIDVSAPLPDGSIPVGPDGGRGGLEAYIGGPALLARLGPPVQTLVDRLGPDDPAMVTLVRAIRIGHAIYRPRHVALLGGIGIRLKRHEGVLWSGVNDRLTSVARPDWTLLFGTDDFHAARGVARMAVRESYYGAFANDVEDEEPLPGPPAAPVRPSARLSKRRRGPEQPG